VAATDDARGDATARFVERFASVLVDSGWPRMPSRVFAALLASDSGRLTSAELSQVLHASPAAISGAVRYLSPLGLISRQRERGSRREVYVVHDDQWHEAILRSDQIMSRWWQVLREGVEALGPATQAGARVSESVAFAEFVREEAHGMLERWHKRRMELQNERGPSPG
jgi:DNA-binding transcriptional regulator GbsR (MarR family)